MDLKPEELPEGFDFNQWHNKMIAPDIIVLGPIRWNYALKKWTALANAYGTLAFIEVRLTRASI